MTFYFISILIAYFICMFIAMCGMCNLFKTEKAEDIATRVFCIMLVVLMGTGVVGLLHLSKEYPW